MTLRNDRELTNTRGKLRLLEEMYRDTSRDRSEDAHVRELSQQSLARMINQLKEEIALYEIHSTGRASLNLHKV
jgi:hypothetical protein